MAGLPTERRRENSGRQRAVTEFSLKESLVMPGLISPFCIPPSMWFSLNFTSMGCLSVERQVGLVQAFLFLPEHSVYVHNEYHSYQEKGSKQIKITNHGSL